jgi:hypothetical protein
MLGKMRFKRCLTVLVALVTVGVLSGCSLLGGTQRDADGEITQATDLDAFALQIGDCLDSTELTADSTEFTEIPAVPCAEPHDSEVIFKFDMPDGDYDPAAIEQAADEMCAPAVEEYIGPAWEDISSQGLAIWWISPTPESWDQSHDREVVCAVYAQSLQLELTSSVKDQGR